MARQCQVGNPHFPTVIQCFPFIATSRKGHEDNFVWNSFRLMAFRFMRRTEAAEDFQMPKGWEWGLGIGVWGLGNGRISMMSRIQIVNWRTFPCTHICVCVWVWKWVGETEKMKPCQLQHSPFTHWNTVSIVFHWSVMPFLCISLLNSSGIHLRDFGA